MATTMYTAAFAAMMNGEIDLEADTIQVLLVDAGYTPSKNHVFVDDVSADELSGTGYVRKTLAGKAVSIDTTNHRAIFDATDPVWTGLDAGTINGAVLFKFVSDDTDSPVIGFLDATDLVTNGSDVTLVFNAGGAFRINN